MKVVGKDFKTKFHRKLVVYQTIGLLVTCLVVSFASIMPLYQYLAEQRMAELGHLVESREMQIQQFLGKALETARQFTSRTKAREALKNYNDGQLGKDEFQTLSNRILTDALRMSEFAKGINRYDNQNKLVSQVGVLLPAEKSPISACNCKTPTIGGLLEVDGNTYLLVNTPIFGAQNEYVGMDRVLFDLEELRAIVKSRVGLGQSGEVILATMRPNGNPALIFPSKTQRQDAMDPTRFSSCADELLYSVFEHSSTSRPEFEKLPCYTMATLFVEQVDWSVSVIMNPSELLAPIRSDIVLLALIVGLVIIPAGIIGMNCLMNSLSGRVIIHVDSLQNEIAAKEEALQERSALAEELRKEKERMEITLRSIGEGVVATDLEGKIQLFNTAAAQLTGWFVEEAIGKPICQVVELEDKTDPQRHPGMMALASKSGRIAESESLLLARDGTQTAVAIGGASIFNNDSKIIGAVVVFRDITTDRQVKEELLKARKLHCIGVLAGGIAHDFNNLLCGILGNLELVEQSGQLDPDSASLLKNAENAALRARSLTSQLLTFSQGGAPVKRRTNLRQFITSSVPSMLQEKLFPCSFTFADDLWDVEIDERQVFHVLQNLILNATYAMPEGGAIHVSAQNIVNISEEQPGLDAAAYVKFIIQDHGVGIPSGDVDRIFDPFFSSKQEGCGLGLAICHSIITKHGGAIVVTSEPGQGTAVSVYLPALVHQQPVALEESLQLSARTASILVMDDEPLIQTILRRGLERMGHTVRIAENGEEALAFYKETPFDLVIMDLTIPRGMGGKDAIAELLKFDPQAKAIVSSGYSNDPVMAQYAEYGFKAAVVKPFELKTLIQLVNELLS